MLTIDIRSYLFVPQRDDRYHHPLAAIIINKKIRLESLNEQKISEEIKSLRIDRYASLIKGIALLIGAIVLFIVVQRPESILNRKLSQETISRERAKMIFDLTQKTKDTEDILFGLSVIKKAYPESDGEWILEIRNMYSTKLQRKINKTIINETDSLYQRKLYKSRVELQKLLEKKEKLQLNLLAESEVIDGSIYRGHGLRTQKLTEMLIDIQNQIDSAENTIKSEYKYYDYEDEPNL